MFSFLLLRLFRRLITDCRLISSSLSLQVRWYQLIFLCAMGHISCPWREKDLLMSSVIVKNGHKFSSLLIWGGLDCLTKECGRSGVLGAWDWIRSLAASAWLSLNIPLEGYFMTCHERNLTTPKWSECRRSSPSPTKDQHLAILMKEQTCEGKHLGLSNHTHLSHEYH